VAEAKHRTVEAIEYLRDVVGEPTPRHVMRASASRAPMSAQIRCHTCEFASKFAR
jgi:hypothetical protein